jgi:apolipoprotein N-acyltransferase
MTTACRMQRHPHRILSQPRMQTPLRLPCLVPALLTGALLWLCHFPAALGWLAWIALVPVLCLVRSGATAWRIYPSALVGALAFYGPALQWMRVADYRMYATWVGLTLYCALFFVLGIALVRRLDRHGRLPLALTLPAVWTAVELTRSWFLTGFPWYYLAHTQHDVLPLIQIADLGGAYAVSFLVAAVNAVVFELLYTRGWFRRLFGLPDLETAPASLTSTWIQAGVVACLIAATLGYGYMRLSQEDFTPGPRVALIQGNLPQGIRNEVSGARENDPAETMWQHFLGLHRQATAQNPRPDLIIWSETSFLYEWIELEAGFTADLLPPSWQKVKQGDREVPITDIPYWKDWLWRRLNAPALEVAQEAGTPVLLGLNAEIYTRGARNRRYNSAILLDPARKVPYAGRYDKIHRVPFGEYVPLREELPWMNSFAPYDFDYSIDSGREWTRFTLGDYRFGVLICYEDTDPDLARRYVAPGSEHVDFLVNISNDGWFDGTSEHEEHLAICRFRAVETRRSVVRAVNMGISAVIDGNGRVVNLPGPTWRDSKKVATVLTATVPIDRRRTLYAALGDWLAWSCCGLIGFGLVRSLIGSR